MAIHTVCISLWSLTTDKSAPHQHKRGRGTPTIKLQIHLQKWHTQCKGPVINLAKEKKKKKQVWELRECASPQETQMQWSWRNLNVIWKVNGLNHVVIYTTDDVLSFPEKNISWKVRTSVVRQIMSVGSRRVENGDLCCTEELFTKFTIVINLTMAPLQRGLKKWSRRVLFASVDGVNLQWKTFCLTCISIS